MVSILLKNKTKRIQSSTTKIKCCHKPACDTALQVTLHCKWHCTASDTTLQVTLHCRWHYTANDTTLQMKLHCKWHCTASETTLTHNGTSPKWHHPSPSLPFPPIMGPPLSPFLLRVAPPLSPLPSSSIRWHYPSLSSSSRWHHPLFPLSFQPIMELTKQVFSPSKRWPLHRKAIAFSRWKPNIT